MVTAVVALLFQAASALPAPVLPLQTGAVWTFKVRVRWTVPNSNQVKSASIRWETRITDTVGAAGVRAAVVLGFPFQLAWYEPDEQPGFDVLIERPDGLWLAPAKSETEAIELSKRAVAGEVVGEQLLRFPVRVGDCLGQDPGRTDKRYCWFVERRIKEHGVSGWDLAYRTAPDHEVLRVIPGLGITRYTYEHHGTVASAEARLERYTPGQP